MSRLSLSIAFLLPLLLCGCPERERAADSSTSADAPAPAARRNAALSPSVRIWADPALRHGLEGLAEHFVATYPGGWEIEYVNRGRLQEILDAGRPELGDEPTAGPLANPPEGMLQPQVLLIADRKLADELVQGSHIATATLRTFAGDRVAVLQRADDRWPAADIAEIPQLRFKTFGAGGVNTSFGYYGQMALISGGVQARLDDRLKLYQDYDEMLGALSSGELDMALGLASAIAGLGFKAVSVLPADLHEDIRYLAVATVGHDHDDGVAELLRLLAEDAEVQTLLGGYGYVDRQTALIEVR